MKLLTSLILLPMLMLVGCKGQERWISLNFSGPVTHDGRVLPSASARSHESQLANQFEKMGIAPGALKIRRDRDDQSVVHIKMVQGALDAQQQEAIKSYLIGLIESRRHANFRMSLTTDKTAIEEVASKLSMAGMKSLVTFNTLGHFSVNLLDPQSLKPYRPGDTGERAVCAVTLRLQRPTSVSYSSIERIEGAAFSGARKPNVYGEVRSLRPSMPEQLMKVPVLLSIEDADLRRLLNEGRLQVHFQLEPPQRSWGAWAVPMYGVENISFTLTSIDVSDIANPVLRYSRMHQQCTREVATLERPFSFQTGRGLDSLRDAVFWDEP
ncbi:diguanylate cyclase [Pseudomonas sp. StFLB209]|uniref:hypothetical protein n=1 Tax=Pseudomonas sp. StFLB209 TaxID=1028989 RepID=UPI0004F62013|nr:hypothetical protein [Pseudomonas sp. StFLB209]BAP43089.1 diguanylate cyclase [Pseudomonas sp. StFLB209]